MEALVSNHQSQVEKYKKEAEEARAELEEFMSYSHAMEAELDEELNLEKTKSARLEKELSALRHRFEKYKEEVNRHRADSLATDSKRNDELKSLRTENEKLNKIVRELEQKNDDLERELRIKTETLKDTERGLNEELELRALLSTELAAKEELGEHCQRLEDEIRDLRLDNSVKDAKLHTRRGIEKGSSSLLPEDRDELQIVQRLSSVKVPKINGEVGIGMNGSLYSPLSSPLARNISPVIAKLLRTVQDLEKRLLSMHPEKNTLCENGLTPLNRR